MVNGIICWSSKTQHMQAQDQEGPFISTLRDVFDLQYMLMYHLALDQQEVTSTLYTLSLKINTTINIICIPELQQRL